MEVLWRAALGLKNTLTPPEGFFVGVSSCLSRFLTMDCTSVPEEASPPEPLPEGWALSSEVSESDQLQLSFGWGADLEGTLGG